MNYFSHAIRFLDRPCFVVGTAIPDWLSAFDRKVRMRPIYVTPLLEDDDPNVAEIAAGITQHWYDDRWFHQSTGFYDVTGKLAEMFRQALVEHQGMRPGFLGHIVTELLLDAELIEEHPPLLDKYYALFDDVDPTFVEQCVNRMSRRPTDRLAKMIPLFVRERFLGDYLQPDRLLYRLNQVMNRVKLGQLPDSFVDSLIAAREIVADRRDDLLPPRLFVPTAWQADQETPFKKPLN